MKINNNILSFCIATYNRENTLKLSLPDLIEKIKKYEIKIFISDNASTDNTESYILSLQKVYPYIFYKKNETNIGADANFEKVLKFSDTKYRWLLNDHNGINDISSLEEIIKYLTTSDNIDILVVNEISRIKNIESRIYTNHEEVIIDLGWHMTLMSSLIYSEKIIQQANFKKYHGNIFLQTLVVFEYIASHDFKLLWLSHPVLKNFDIIGNPTWHNDVFNVFGKVWYNSIKSLPSNYSNAAKEKCIKDHGYYANMFTLERLEYFRTKGGISIRKVCRNLYYIYKVSNMKTVMSTIILCFIPMKHLKNFNLFIATIGYLKLIIKYPEYRKGLHVLFGIYIYRQDLQITFSATNPKWIKNLIIWACTHGISIDGAKNQLIPFANQYKILSRILRDY
jgi:hypothetical protein